MTSDICQGENSSEPILSSVTSHWTGRDVLIPHLSQGRKVKCEEPWPVCWGLVSRFTETRIRRDLIIFAGGQTETCDTLSSYHYTQIISAGEINLQVQLMDCIEMVLSLARNSHQIWHIPSWFLINFYKTSTSPGARVSHLPSGNQGKSVHFKMRKTLKWEMLISD